MTYTGYFVTTITNPCILSQVLLVLLAITGATKLNTTIGSVVILILCLAILPFIYVTIRVFVTENKIKLMSDPTDFLKQHPLDILIIAILFGLPGLIGLVLIESAPVLIETYIIFLAVSLVIALANLFYRVSYHLSAITIIAIMAPIAWGQNYLVLVVLIPIVAWAKHYTKHHTLVQLGSGIALAATISGITLLFYY